MKKIATAFLLILFSVIATAAVAADWRLYTNPTDGSSLDVPAFLFSDVEPSEEGEGVLFFNPDTGVSLTIYSIDNEQGLSLSQTKRLIAQADESREITYERIKRNWFVLSGYENEEAVRSVFYSRLAANRDQTRFAAFELVYPVAVRELVDPVVRRMSLSLKAPRR